MSFTADHFHWQPGLTSRGFNGFGIHISGTLAGIIRESYGLLCAEQLSGPAWIDAARFEVAEPLPAGSFDAFRVAMRALLADRFQLLVEHEIHQVQGFLLKLAPAGPTLVKVEWPKPGAPPPPGWFPGETIGQLTGILSHRLRAPVIDSTGLDGAYRIFRRGGFPAGARADTGQLATWLSDQFGLVLQPQVLSLDAIVVTRVARPGLKWQIRWTMRRARSGFGALLTIAGSKLQGHNRIRVRLR